jgi:NDP-4-keto-2,6-dideoxyhexose 3-C-methyltransferase
MTVTEQETRCYVTRRTCRACAQPLLRPVLSLGMQYLVEFPKQIDEDLPKAPLDLVQCDNCGLLQLGHSADPELLYRDFWYRSSVNQTMRDALKDVVRDARHYKTGGTWLDIGANDGCLLSYAEGFYRVGCEPARVFEPDLKKHCDEVLLDFFGAQMPPKSCDVITSIAMFYDLDDPDTFLQNIVAALKDDGIWINQLNDSPTMLARNAFDAIVHEHLCYYDVPSLAKLYARHGLEIVRITRNEVNGGSVRVTAQKRQGHKLSLEGLGGVSREQADQFAQRIKDWRRLMQDFAGNWRNKRIWGYGASTKGCCLLQYLGDPWVEMLHGIADRNPHKHGLVMAGTWTPILAEEHMRDDNPDLLVVFPWAFKEEFIAREAEQRAKGTVMLFPLPNIEWVL